MSSSIRRVDNSLFSQKRVAKLPESWSLGPVEDGLTHGVSAPWQLSHVALPRSFSSSRCANFGEDHLFSLRYVTWPS